MDVPPTSKAPISASSLEEEMEAIYSDDEMPLLPSRCMHTTIQVNTSSKPIFYRAKTDWNSGVILPGKNKVLSA